MIDFCQDVSASRKSPFQQYFFFLKLCAFLNDFVLFSYELNIKGIIENSNCLEAASLPIGRQPSVPKNVTSAV